MSSQTPSHPFLAGGGQVAELIAAYDWRSTPMGPLAAWPAHVKTATALMLRCQVPIVMLWGETGVMIYNDAYSVFAAARHPRLLGSRVREGWPEVADFNDNVMKVGLAGGTLNYQDQELTLHRHGRAEQVWMNLDYSPLLDEHGVPVGVMAVVIETSAKVLAERHASGERERLARMFEQAPSFMALLQGPEHRFELVNPAYLRLVSHRPVLGRTLAEALPDAAAQGYLALLDQVYRTGEAYAAHGAHYSMQIEADRPPLERYVDFVFQPMRDTAGSVTGIFVEGVDVTGRMTAEQRREALAQLSDTLRNLDDPADVGFVASELLGRTLQASRVGYATIDPDAETLHVDRDWNAPGVESLAGVLHLRDYGSFIDSLKRNEFIAITDVRDDLRTADAAPALEARSARSFVNVPVIEQGRLVAVLYVNHAQVRGWSADDLAFVREVANRTRMATERLRGEAIVNTIDQRFRALVTATSDVVYRMDARWTEMQQLVGHGFIADTETPSTHWLDRYVPADERPRVAAAIEDAVREQRIFELEHRVLREDGSVGWVFSRAIPVFDTEGRTVEWFGAASDVTRRKQVEQELQASEERLRDADQRKDEFLATLAHELRNPLAPIRNAAHLLAMAAQEGVVPRVREVLDRQVGHMVRLVDDLLEVSRISRGQIELKRETLDIAQVVDAAVEASRPGIEQAGHRLTVTPAETPQWVHGDPVRLTQVLVNLLNNAARYTDEGGAVRVAVQRDGDAVLVQVSDNGIGIAADQLPRIFEMFTQADRSQKRAQGGLGIGLALSQRLLLMHGATLRAESAGPGQGSRFTMSVPLANPPPSTAAVVAAAAPARQRPPLRQRVLVVDDNRDAAESTGLLIEMMGADVRTANGGERAIELVRDWQPDIALLDIGMPTMDGHELARRIRAGSGWKQPVLVALTGWGTQRDRALTQSAGFDHHLVKPVDGHTLESLLARKHGDT
ncbi:MAG: ATP-binding protein [Pseudomonadota bacterium]